MLETLETDKRGLRYTDEQRDAAFEVWAYKADRSFERAAIIIDIDDTCKEVGVSGVSARTLRNWSLQWNWENKANVILHKSAPGRRVRVQSALVLAAPEAAEFLRKLINLDESLKTERIETDKDGNTSVVKEFNDKILTLQQKSAMAVLDRVGFSPIGNKELPFMDAPPDLQGEVLKQVSEITDEDELAALSASIKERAGIGRRNG